MEEASADLNIEPNSKNKSSYTARYPIRQPPAPTTEELCLYDQKSPMNGSK